jgi:hypothetical protein
MFKTALKPVAIKYPALPPENFALPENLRGRDLVRPEIPQNSAKMSQITLFWPLFASFDGIFVQKSPGEQPRSPGDRKI